MTLLESISSDALKLTPAKVFGLVLIAPFFVLGFALRMLWMAPAFLLAAGIKGWKRADEAHKRWQLARAKP